MTNKVNFSDGWLTDEIYQYNYSAVDGEESGDLMIRFVADKEYLYENAIMELEVLSPDSLRMVETFSISIDSLAKPLAIDKRVISRIIISDMLLKQGEYQFKLKQKVSDTLEGVYDCRLRIIPHLVE